MANKTIEAKELGTKTCDGCGTTDIKFFDKKGIWVLCQTCKSYIVGKSLRAGMSPRQIYKRYMLITNIEG